MNKENTVNEAQSMTVVWDGERATFAKAFVAAQKGIESIKKGVDNAHFKTKYADLAGVMFLRRQQTSGPHPGGDGRAREDRT